MPKIMLPQGTIHYRDEGQGSPVVLVHGVLVNGRVWDRLVPRLSRHVRCIVPDLPLGSHSQPMDPAADLSPRRVAAIIAELIAQLDLEEVTVVGNDTGGALCQLVATEHPERIAGLVLTNCDAFEHFPPPAFAPVVKLLTRVPGALLLTADAMRFARLRRLGMSFAALTSEPVPDELLRSWFAPLRQRGIRRDLMKVLRGLRPELTQAAAQNLPAFGGRSLIVWGLRDNFFPVTDAERMAQLLPGARLEKLRDARTFVQLDAPARLGELILELVAAVPAEA